MEGEDRTFRVNFSDEGVYTLRDVVRGKLKEFMGDYTDDTLVDYVIVLLKNGRQKDEAKNELDVFLGDDSVPFISWLWDHLGSNLSLYVKKQDLHIDVDSNGEHVAQDQDGRSIVDTKKRVSDRNDSQEIKIPGKNGDENTVPHSDKSHVIDKKISHTDSHRDAVRMKESLSPRQTIDKERWQTDEKHLRRRDVLPVSVSAPRRLLQFAVRDAVATSRPSLKRLRSVVTKTMEDTPPEELPKRTRHISMSAAIKAVAEAANDVRKSRQSRNVFDRIDHGSDFPNTPVLDRMENDQEDFVFDMRERETRGITQLGTFDGNWVENSQMYQHASSTSNEAVHGQHKGPIRLEALANSYPRNAASLIMNSRRPHKSVERDMSETETILKKSSIPVVAFNANVQYDTSQQESQSQIGSQHTVIPVEDADSRTIFVSNVHFAASKDTLSRHFSKFGDVVKVIISIDPSTGQPKGSSYIEFMTKDAAELAMSLNGTSFMSRIIRVVKKSSAQPEPTFVPARPHSQATPFPVQSFGRGIPSVYRPRVPVKPGSRSFQWKRGPNSTATQASSSKFPPNRSFTYVRVEQKSDGNSGNP